MNPGRARHAIRAELAGRAYRVTKPRMAIACELAALSRYVTAKELHARLIRKGKAVGLATVYRTLEALQAVGAASAHARPGGETAYLYCPAQHHHHAVCTACGRVDDVPCRSLARFSRALRTDLRFTLEQHRLEFFGRCARCA